MTRNIALSHLSKIIDSATVLVARQSYPWPSFPPPTVAALGAPAPRPRRQRPKPPVVTVAAAFTAAGDSAPSQFLASVLSDSSHTVVFTSAQQLSEAIFARASHVLRSSHATGSREARRLYCRLQLGDDVTGDEVMVLQAAADNIATAARLFGAALPTDAADLLGRERAALLVRL